MEPKVSSFVNENLPTSATVERVAQGAHEAIDRVAAQAGPAVERVRSAATGAAASIETKAGQIGDWEKQRLEALRVHVRQNPLSSIALAVLAGVLVSRIVSR